MCVTEVVLLLGVSIVSASWVFLVFPIIIGVGAVHFRKMEEVGTLGHYGAICREYMDRPPRWLGIPKSKKNCCVLTREITLVSVYDLIDTMHN